MTKYFVLFDIYLFELIILCCIRIYIYILLIFLGIPKDLEMVRPNRPIPKYFVPLDKLKRAPKQYS